MHSFQEIRNIFDGYCKQEPTFPKHCESLIKDLFCVLSEPSLAFEQMRQILAVLKTRIKPHMFEKLNGIMKHRIAEFPAKAVQDAVNVSISIFFNQ